MRLAPTTLGRGEAPYHVNCLLAREEASPSNYPNKDAISPTAHLIRKALVDVKGVLAMDREIDVLYLANDQSDSFGTDRHRQESIYIGAPQIGFSGPGTPSASRRYFTDLRFEIEAGP